MALTQKQQALEGFTPTRRSGNRMVAQAVAGSEVVRPVASPISTYVPPPPVETQQAQSPLLQLGVGLRSLDRGLDNIVSARIEEHRRSVAKKEREDALQAIDDFYKRDDPSVAKAVKEGKIPPDASPAYMETSREEEGKVRGRQLATEIEEAYDTWEGRTTADAAGFGTWLKDQVKGRIEGVDDKHVLRGMIPFIENMRTRLTAHHSSEKSKAVAQATLDNAAATVNDVVEAQLKRDPTGGTFDPKKAAAEIETTSQNLLRVGVRPADLNKVIVDTVIDKAVASNNPEFLEVLLQRRGDGQRGPGETKYGRDKIADAREKIFSQAVRLDGIVHTREEREKKKVVGLATRKVIDLLSKDPYGDIPVEILQLGTDADPDFEARVERLRGTFAAKDSREDPKRAREAEIRIYQSESPFDTAVQEIEAGNIKNPITVGRLLDRTSGIQKSRERGEASILKLPAMGRYRKLIEQQLTDNDPYNIDGRADANFAIGDMEARLSEWEIKNPRATATERMQAVERIGEEIRGAIDADRKYNREQVRELPAPKAEPKNQGTPGTKPTDEAFNAEGPDYDYDTAKAAGMGPSTESGENAGHWGSVAPASATDRKKYGLPDESYVVLKGKSHSTFDKAVAGEKERGFEVRKYGDRYYSVPATHPQQQQGAAEQDDAVKIIQARIKALESMGGKLVGRVKVGKGSREVEGAIAKAAKKHGVDVETLRGIAWLESTMDGNAKPPLGADGKRVSTAEGLFQFIDGTAAQYGLTDKFNVEMSADAGARLLVDNQKNLTQVLGRKATPGELYLAHQQGAGGAAILLRQPNMKAVDALSKLKGVTPEEAEARIRLNLPPRVRHRAKDITAGEFAKLWVSKLDG